VQQYMQFCHFELPTCYFTTFTLCLPCDIISASYFLCQAQHTITSWGTGIRGLTRSKATLPKVTRSH